MIDALFRMIDINVGCPLWGRMTLNQTKLWFTNSQKFNFLSLWVKRNENNMGCYLIWISPCVPELVLELILHGSTFISTNYLYHTRWSRILPRYKILLNEYPPILILFSQEKLETGKRSWARKTVPKWIPGRVKNWTILRRKWSTSELQKNFDIQNQREFWISKLIIVCPF